MKRVLVVAPREDWLSEPAFRIRLGVLGDAMRRRGFAWEIRARPAGPVGRMALAKAAGEFHAVVLHRRMLDPYEARAYRKSMQAPRRMLMDIDDATMYHETQLGKLARWRLQRRFAATARVLDLVCAGNAYLAGIFQERGVKTCIVPSVVDPAGYPVKEHAGTESPGLVWIGSSSTLKYLEAILPALEQAAGRVGGLRLVVICDRAPRVAAGSVLRVEFVPWTLEGEAAALLKGEIGLAPMPENRWTLGKCGFKVIQYMAAGLPVIATDVGVHRELVDGLGGGAAAGVLVREAGDWVGVIEQLAGDVAKRAALGNAGRRRVETEFCLERIADRWAEARRDCGAVTDSAIHHACGTAWLCRVSAR